MPALSVLSVASEIFPLVKTGGLADVAGALPPALKAERIRMVTLVPGYPELDPRQEGYWEHFWRVWNHLVAGSADRPDVLGERRYNAAPPTSP